MKTSVPIFLTGLILGIAGTIALRPDPAAPDASEITDTPNQRPARTHADRENEISNKNRKTVRMRRTGNKKGKHSNGGARDDLGRFLTELSKADDGVDLDLMSLIRNASLMTMLREDEATDLLQLLTEPVEEIQNGMDEEFREAAAVIVFCRLCELNGPEAMRIATEKDQDGEQRFDDEEFLAMGMNSWVAADPEGARRWFEGQVTEAEKLATTDEDVDLQGPLSLLENDDFRAAYFNGMAKHDPEGVEQQIATIENDEARETLQDDFMKSMVRAEESVEGLQALLEKTSDSSEARSEAVEKLSEKDPDSAAKWVESQSITSDRDRQIKNVATALIKKDSDAGIEWYMDRELHDPNAHSGRLAEVVGHLANEDLEKAGQWLKQQPDSITRDSAERAIATRLANAKRWSESITWIASVQDEDTRNQGLKYVFDRSWNNTTAGLPPELIQAAEAAGFEDQVNSYRK